MNSPPILLTSSVVVHDPAVALQDSAQRIAHTLECIKHWMRLAPDSPIVVCDGSGFDFTPLLQPQWGTYPLECLHFTNNQQEVARLGRGFGEGEIVRHALSHSQFIQSAGSFAKCTAKLWVENYAQCLRYWHGDLLLKGVFANEWASTRPTRLQYIDTRFYMCSVPTYLQHFVDAHLQIDQASGRGLEECFLTQFLAGEFAGALCGIYPVICGVGGGTAKPYRTTISRRVKEWGKLQSVRRNREFSALFASPH